MAGRLMRRSGMSVGQVAEHLNWRADVIYQVGVGLWHAEVEVLQEEWPGVEFMSTEPDPRIVKELKKEGYPGELTEVALGSKVGRSTLYFKSRHKDGSSLYPHKKQKEGVKHDTISVPVTTLDILYGKPRKGRILLWMDCEGSELEVLKGGEQFIEGVDVVNVEITGRPPCHGWPTPEEVHDWLVDRGYFLQWIHTQRIWENQCDGIYVRAEMFRPDCCCIVHEVKRYRSWVGNRNSSSNSSS